MIRYILVIIPLLLLSCSKKITSDFENLDRKESLKIVNIEEGENAYFIDCENKKGEKYKLISKKENISECNKEIIVGKRYTLSFKIEVFSGHFDGYMYDEKFFPLETILVFSKDLKGLCVIR